MAYSAALNAYVAVAGKSILPLERIAERSLPPALSTLRKWKVTNRVGGPFVGLWGGCFLSFPEAHKGTPTRVFGEALIEYLIAMKLGLSWRPCALRPAAFALVLPGGGSRCARRICCHLLATECEHRRREHSSRKKPAIPAIKHSLTKT